MPFLSRVYLNPLRTGAQRILRNPQALHAALLGGLSRQPVTERVLWRLDTEPHRMAVLVLTESRPSWEHLVEQAGWPGSDDPQALVRPYEPLLDQVVRGREFAFRLRANPVTSTRNPLAPSAAQRKHLESAPQPRGVRVAHRTAAHQLTWLTERIEKWGFSLLTSAEGGPAVQLVARDRLSFSKSAGEGRRRVTLQTATFDGLLRVEDAKCARDTLLAGVGPGKAYGLGLVTLAPPRAAPAA
jgi:CRISPR system Cascade subunit CasE